ncbi:NfeD family protein, partial [Pseudomonas aeruginosa]|uniref:NfeD family protein n=1 Tax=Pseudomonas aeruginosa TaxID=287 RepID=UPI002F92EEB0
QRGRRYGGRVLVLSEAIVNGIGQVRLEDTVWRVAGPDLPRGSRVRVTGSEGATLRVEAVSEQAH